MVEEGRKEGTYIGWDVEISNDAGLRVGAMQCG